MKNLGEYLKLKDKVSVFLDEKKMSKYVEFDEDILTLLSELSDEDKLKVIRNSKNQNFSSYIR